jgi:site-specific DNA-cytosine methylase
VDDYETWEQGGIVPTLNGFDMTDVRATTIVFPTIVGTVMPTFDSKNYSNIQEVNNGAVILAPRPRRLMPIECERLQGFPDNWTANQSDTARYKQTGNAVTVNVVSAILANLVAVHEAGSSE